MQKLLTTIAFVALSIASQAAERPNIFLMLADDLDWGDLSCYGSPNTAAPNLDKLAATGLRFTDFHAASGVCSPSRAARVFQLAKMASNTDLTAKVGLNRKPRVEDRFQVTEKSPPLENRRP